MNEIEDATEAESVIRNHFANMDANKDNKISWDEWKQYHMDHKTPMSKSQDLMKEAFKTTDRDNSGYIDFNEFFNVAMYEWNVARLAKKRQA